MDRLRAAIAARLLECLRPEERAAIEGDFAELHIATGDAIGELLGLVIRRHVTAWADWRAWIALIVALLLSMMLSVVSRFWAHSTAIYAWLYLDNWTSEYLRSPGARMDLLGAVVGFGLEGTALAVWAWTIGSAVRALSPRTAVITFLLMITVVFVGTSGSTTIAQRNPGNAIVFAEPIYRDVLPAAFRVIFVVAPLLWTLRRRNTLWTRNTGRAALVLVAAVVLTALVGRRPAVAITFGWWSISADRPMIPAMWSFRLAWQVWLFSLVTVCPAAYVFFNSAWRSGQQKLSAPRS